MRAAARIASATDAELMLIHVRPAPAMLYADALAFPDGADAAAIQRERRALGDAEREAGELGVRRVTARFVTGAPWDRIVEAARDDAAFDLIVMGTHGRTGLRHLLLGSVAEKVVRHAPCSDLVVHDHDDPSAFRRVLCPIDFSEFSEQAVALASRFVAAGGEITLLHVLELATIYGGELSTSALDELDLGNARRLQDWAARLRTTAPVPVTAISRTGSASGQTLALLNEPPPFDLVVIGSHGRTGLRRALLGSVAEKTVRHAPCPVLVARERA
jgi:nucleotide-binding universal stress UspA family protein